MAEWKVLGWRRKVGKGRTRPIHNLALWQALDALCSAAPAGHLSIRWVKGHVNHKMVEAGIATAMDAWANGEADRLACRAADVPRMVPTVHGECDLSPFPTSHV